MSFITRLFSFQKQEYTPLDESLLRPSSLVWDPPGRPLPCQNSIRTANVASTHLLENMSGFTSIGMSLDLDPFTLFSLVRDINDPVECTRPINLLELCQLSSYLDTIIVVHYQEKEPKSFGSSDLSTSICLWFENDRYYALEANSNLFPGVSFDS